MNSNYRKKYLFVLAALVNGTPLHVMLADDDEDDRENFVEAIHHVSSQTKVTTVTDGAKLMEALSAGDANVPDILFLDLNMPRKNGFECLREIRDLPKFKSVPVIVYSTSSDPELINRTYDKGANLYLEKPQSFREIKRVMGQILSLPKQYFFPQLPKSEFVVKQS